MTRPVESTGRMHSAPTSTADAAVILATLMNGRRLR